MRRLAAALILLLFSRDALAWGLETHVFFAQWLIGGLALADDELRAVAARLPRLVLAGACLPDLALAGKLLGSPAFRRAHEWWTLRRMASAPREDADRALAIGYASHLVSDVVAHNDFVPEHEARIARVRHLTHAIAEFAMDEHLRCALEMSPSEALDAERAAIVQFVARSFRCEPALAERAVSLLSGADRGLRATRLPRSCRRVVELFYRDPAYRFDGYVARVKTRLQSLERALAGEFVDWVSLDPEGRCCDAVTDGRAGEHVARIVQPKHHARGGD